MHSALEAEFWRPLSLGIETEGETGLLRIGHFDLDWQLWFKSGNVFYFFESSISLIH